jgi:lipoate-protein ligase B
MTRDVLLHRPGIVPYRDAWRWQQATAAAVSAGALEAVAILQHPPVYTLGRRSLPENLLVDAATLAQRGAAVVQTDRGGDVTFHGPGQLVAYPILNLRARGIAPTDYVRLLEETMLLTVQRFGITAERHPGRPGIWSDGAKLGAVGVRVQGGISMHGLALNVDVDLAWFDAIIPCGLTDITVTSMQRLVRHSASIAAVDDSLIAAFEHVFLCHLSNASPEPLGAADRSSRGRGGAAHARGAWGVSPQPSSFLGVGAEQRGSDAQQTWQPQESGDPARTGVLNGR